MLQRSASPERTAGRDASPSKVPITTHVLKRLTGEAPGHSATVIGEPI